VVAAHIEQRSAAAPSVKQHLAALRMLIDWLVLGQIKPMNQARSARGPKFVVKKGKTPVLSTRGDTATARLRRDWYTYGIARLGADCGEDVHQRVEFSIPHERKKPSHDKDNTPASLREPLKRTIYQPVGEGRGPS
jgi:hypothetical protein